MIIYKITNLVNDKIYIGKTIKSIDFRFSQHLRKTSGCLKLVRAIKKYGKNNFKIEQIDIAENNEELNKKEIMWISKLNSINCGYNLTNGGTGGPMIGEALEKIRKAARLRKTSDKTKAKMSKQRSGHLNGRAKKVMVTLENGVTISFECIKYAAEYLKIAHSTARCIAQKRSNHGYAFLKKLINIEYIGE